MKIEFSTDNDAFKDINTGEKTRLSESLETARILRDIANKVEEGYTNRYILDINGNKIGEWSL